MVLQRIWQEQEGLEANINEFCYRCENCGKEIVSILGSVLFSSATSTKLN